MNPDLIEELLNEEESTTLDFKSEQYPFSKTTDDKKGELLKDILAFANAWRRTDAYILVGVKNIKGGRSEVIGIASDFDDASIQQFINGKTNRNIEFSYKTISVDGIKIGVFHIPLQERPFYLKKDYGKLKQNTVYIRRSSSTGEADLDEIAKMGVSKFDKSQTLAIPKLELQFFDNKDKLLLGNSINITSKILEYDKEEIVGKAYSSFEALHFNAKFEWDLAEYLATTSLVKSVCFNLTNISPTLANNVRLEIIIIRDGTPLVLLDKRNYPSMPGRTRSYNLKSHSLVTHTTIESTKYIWKLSASFGNIQPKASSQSDVFYIGAYKPCKLKLEIAVFADNLPDPLIFPLTIDVKTETASLDTSKFIHIK